jgi:hypothetical protein
MKLYIHKSILFFHLYQGYLFILLHIHLLFLNYIEFWGGSSLNFKYVFRIGDDLMTLKK